MELTVSQMEDILQQHNFMTNLLIFTGCRFNNRPVIYLVAFAKSKQLKTLGNLELVPALFNINEPILFGLPVVMNPMLAVPFIAMPVISCVSYNMLHLQQVLCPLYGGVMVPWTCPLLISEFLVGGWRSALLQLVIFIISFLFICHLFVALTKML